MRIRTIIRLAAISLPVVIAGCDDTPEGVNLVYGNEQWDGGASAYDPYERGKKHFADGHFGMAVKDFERALLHDPRSVETLNAVAATYDRLGRFDQSERYYLRALTLDPNSVQSLNNLGYSYLLQRRYDLAMTYLREAKTLDPSNTFIALNIQKAEAASELSDSDFVSAPIQDGWFEQLAGSAPRAAPRTPVVAVETAVAVKTEADGEAESAAVVQIVTQDSETRPWIERTAPEVQTLVTQSSLEIDLAVSEWGVRPALANYRPQSAIEASAKRRTPWDIVTRPDGSGEIEATPPVDLFSEPGPAEPSPAEPAELSDESIASGDSPATETDEPDREPASVASAEPSDEAAASDAVQVTPPVDLVAEFLPADFSPADFSPADFSPTDFSPTDFSDRSEEIAAADTQVALAPSDQAASIAVSPVNLVPGAELSFPAVTEELSASPMNLVPSDLLDTVEPAPKAVGPVDLLPVDFAPGLAADFVVDDDLPMQESQAVQAGGEEVPLVEVSNGTGRVSMAHRVGEFLQDRGFTNTRLTNAEHFGFSVSTIYYRDGWLDQARRITAELPVKMLLEAAPDQAVDIRIRLGGDLLTFDRELFYANGKPASAPAG